MSELSCHHWLAAKVVAMVTILVKTHDLYKFCGFIGTANLTSLQVAPMERVRKTSDTNFCYFGMFY